MDPNVLKSLISYMEHQQYIHKAEGGKDVGMPPRVPDFLRAEEVQVDLGEEENFGEDEEGSEALEENFGSDE